MHSTCSDGSLGVQELVRAVHAAGVDVFALTDHDTLEGLDVARLEAQRLGLGWISGVEISTRFAELELHVLGYGFDVENRELDTLLRAQKIARRERIPRIVAKLNEFGVDLSVADVDAVAQGANPGRPHVARALVARGFVRDVEDAFTRYLGEGGSVQLPKPLPTPEVAIAAIHAAGGKAVWAHPLASAIRRSGGLVRIARDLAAQGLDGLEEVHPAHDAGDRKQLRKLARELGLECSGGSDFHGGHGAAGPGVTDAEVPTSFVRALLSNGKAPS
jgi:predicted metal-dependent phosphoesterase TrpH